MTRKNHPKHPNCPICSNNIGSYLEWSKGNCYNMRVKKLYTLYSREKNTIEKRVFRAVGWYCRECGFSITNKFFEKRTKKNKNKS